jgi:UDP-glucose 4-epimerase
VVQLNWNETKSLELHCKGVDVVIKAAGMNAQNCASDPVAALEFNGLATARLASAACNMDVQRMIYLSTAHVYGSPLVGAINEDSCVHNIHPYATSHLAGENAVLGATQQGQLHGVVLRLANAFGAPMYDAVDCWMLLVNDLCRQAVQMQKLILESSGEQQRDFIGINEVCHLIEKLVVRPGGNCQAEIFNIGSGISQSVLAMAQVIQERCVAVLGFEPELQRKDGGVNRSLAPLTYEVNRLSALGIKIDQGSSVKEIDSLLKYCATVFR